MLSRPRLDDSNTGPALADPGLDAFAPCLRVRLCAGRVLDDGTFADVSAVLDGTVNATDRKELARAAKSCAGVWRPRSRRAGGRSAATGLPES
ncbi:hypothetical protein [Kitasatospora sp. NBC_01302]|uniref:hypothetical protein n=1 Tax=Kitasatospora sp. NBC_01302 TaxID=2903575 RepID=UPI002E161EC2|nr:hypothetical protein OG294_39405 [Kitasatospora sp. NBC_01302]